MPILFFVAVFFVSFFLSFFLTLGVRKFAIYFKIFDYPSRAPERKIHFRPIPLLGGLAPSMSFFLVLGLLFLFNFWPKGSVLPKHLIGLLIGSFFLMIGGFLDDKYNLKPYWQIIWPILAIGAVIASGIGIHFVNHPFKEGFLYLDRYKIEVIRISGVPYYFTPLADFFTLVWLLILMYSTKFLDGLDGLVSGITSIGALTIFGLCFFTKFYQPDVGLLSLILAAVFLGFLVLNFHPAKIFLGEGGSLWSGFMLGALSIISGGKIATTFLVLGIVILDMVLVITKRILKRQLPFLADKEHFHFKLLEAGFSHRGAVLFLYLLGILLGIGSLFLKTTRIKFLTLIFLIIFSTFLILVISFKAKKKTSLTKI